MKQKRHILVVFIIVFVLFAFAAAFPYLLGHMLLGDTSYELLTQSVSPNKKYTVHAYRVNSGATVDYSIEVYIMEDSKKTRRIYNGYHERNADIYWINDSTVCINDKILDLDEGEKYDWRKSG